MVSQWKTNSYLNNKHIQIGDIDIMNSAYGLSGSFGSILRSRYIVNNSYTGRKSNFRSKPTPIHVPVHKSDLNYS